MKVAFVIFLIGERYKNTFNEKFKNNILNYCSKHSYELIILNEVIENDGENSGETVLNKKKFYWQRLLISNKFKEYDFVISLDSDILVNPNAPPLPLDIIPQGKVAAINERKYLENYEWREKIQLKNNWERTGID